MRRAILFVCVIITLLISEKSQAQNPAKSAVQNYVVLTKDIQQLKPIILAANDLAAEDGIHFGMFKVIICGKTVTGLIQKEKIAPVLAMAEKYHVELYACGLSLTQFKVNTRELPKQIQVTKNGILYNFQLQKKGYLSIEL